MGIDTDFVVGEIDRRIDHYRNGKGDRVEEDIYEPIFGCDSKGNVVYFDANGVRAHESCPHQIAGMAIGSDNAPCVYGWDPNFLSAPRPSRQRRGSR